MTVEKKIDLDKFRILMHKSGKQAKAEEAEAWNRLHMKLWSLASEINELSKDRQAINRGNGGLPELSYEILQLVQEFPALEVEDGD